MNNKVLWDMVNKEVDRVIDERYKTRGQKQLAVSTLGYPRIVETVHLPIAEKFRNIFYEQGLLETAKAMEEIIEECKEVAFRGK